MLKLILAVSADGFLATGPDDDMRWTGKTDKRVFRLLTSVGAVCGAGRTTWEQMPKLPGRRLVPLSRTAEKSAIRLSPASSGMPADDSIQIEECMTLGRFAHLHPEGWLIGGPTVAMEALGIGLVDQAFLCRSTSYIHGGMADTVTPWLTSRGESQNAGVPWSRTQRIDFEDVSVDVWSRLDARRS